MIYVTFKHIKSDEVVEFKNNEKEYTIEYKHENERPNNAYSKQNISKQEFNHQLKDYESDKSYKKTLDNRKNQKLLGKVINKFKSIIGRPIGNR